MRRQKMNCDCSLRNGFSHSDNKNGCCQTDCRISVFEKLSAKRRRAFGFSVGRSTDGVGRSGVLNWEDQMAASRRLVRLQGTERQRVCGKEKWCRRNGMSDGKTVAR